MDECPRGTARLTAGRGATQPVNWRSAARADSKSSVNDPGGQQPRNTEARAFAESPSGPRWTVARTACGHRSTGRQPRPSRTWSLDRSCLDGSPWLPRRPSWPRSRSPPRRRARALRTPRPRSTPPRSPARSSYRETLSASSCASTPRRPPHRSTGSLWGRTSRSAAEGRSRRPGPSSGMGIGCFGPCR